MVIRNPITDAAALAVDGNRYPEKRMQELLDCWLQLHFTGAPITVDALAAGTTELRTFPECKVAWMESTESGGGKPLIHLSIQDHRESRRAISPRTIQVRHVWYLQALVKIPRNLTATANKPQPDFIVRAVAADLEWLARGPEKLALAALGVEGLKVRGPSVPVPTAQWQARSVVLECVTRQEIPRQ